ncbi:hypothetical protein A7K50_05635 [Dehalobacter sp. MCB1]|nr:hypothetical protein A7K50_05635 [Dehalobacter sp. MCB1]
MVTERSGSMVNEFKQFIMKGNVVDLAVAVIIGGAFGKIVTSLVNDILMPVIGFLLGRINFTNLKIVITEATDGVPEAAIRYGAFIQSIVDFLIISLAIFFMLKVLIRFRTKKEEEPPAPEVVPPEPSKQEILLTEIRDILKFR